MPTVLVVDDSPLIRRTLATRFSTAGFDVREASSVNTARAVACDGIGCAVIDLQLGDGDGTDLATALLARRPGLAIAFFTGGGAPALVESARCRGPVFLKPDVEALLAWVRRTLRPSQSQPPPTK
jgi:DNA-binding NtrC family response regulator